MTSKNDGEFKVFQYPKGITETASNLTQSTKSVRQNAQPRVWLGKQDDHQRRRGPYLVSNKIQAFSERTPTPKTEQGKAITSVCSLRGSCDPGEHTGSCRRTHSPCFCLHLCPAWGYATPIHKRNSSPLRCAVVKPAGGLGAWQTVHPLMTQFLSRPPPKSERPVDMARHAPGWQPTVAHLG